MIEGVRARPLPPPARPALTLVILQCLSDDVTALAACRQQCPVCIAFRNLPNLAEKHDRGRLRLLFQGLVSYVPAVAYHFCLILLATFSGNGL